MHPSAEPMQIRMCLVESTFARLPGHLRIGDQGARHPDQVCRIAAEHLFGLGGRRRSDR